MAQESQNGLFELVITAKITVERIQWVSDQSDEGVYDSVLHQKPIETTTVCRKIEN